MSIVLTSFSSDVVVCLRCVCLHWDVEFGEVPSSVAVTAAGGHHWTGSVARDLAARVGMGGACLMCLSVSQFIS